MKRSFFKFCLYCIIVGSVPGVQPLLAQQPMPAAYSGTAPINYVRTYDALAPMTDPNQLLLKGMQDVRQTTQYLDGLGRPIQTVIRQGSLITGGAATDLVSPNLYDQFDREQYKYLPFGANNTGGNTSITDGLFKLNPFQQDSVFSKAQYPGETYYYGKTEFDGSPLNRSVKEMSPGNNWVGTSRGVHTNYWLNTTTDSIRIWNVTDVVNDFGAYSSPGFYSPGKLNKSVIVDEHGKQVVEFKDKNGSLILKKVQLTATADAGTGAGYQGWLCTYYLYDDIARLRAVVQPQGVQLLLENSWSMTALSNAILNEQCFRYEYDLHNKMIRKKVPGAGETWMVYDARDRLVMSQDANMRAAHQWMYMQYDELNRPVVTGLITDNTNYNNLAYHASAAASSTAYPNLGSYTTEELTRTFYDDYDWLSVNGNPFSASKSNDYGDHLLTPSNSYPYAQAVTQSFATVGMITGTKTKVLGTGTYLYGITYYDDRQRVIQTISDNITGAKDMTTTQYDFSGKVLLQTVSSIKDLTVDRIDFVRTAMEYDDLGRLSTVKKKPYSYFDGSWKGGVEKQLLLNEYDALGQLKKKKLAPAYNSGAGLDSLSYDYNIRGWMLGMNRRYAKDEHSNNYFGFDLGYDKTNNGIVGNQSYSNAQYNGNIAGMVWKSKGDGEKRKYDFSYDAVNRLLKADFNQYTSASFNKTALVDFSVSSMSYDRNGNILNMTQHGLKLASSAILDSLVYGYESSSNKLSYVTDKANDANTQLGDFKEINNNTTVDYGYDDNGNLSLDNNKAISSITYNHLNLTAVIHVLGKGNIRYTYDAWGNKLKKITEDSTVSPVRTTTTLYVGASVYQNDTLQFITQEEGRIRYRASDNTFQYDYFEKDHLGNVRMVLTEEEQTDMYPAATMETATATTEEAFYSNLPATRITTLPVDYPANTPAGNAAVAKVNGSGNKIGPAIVLKVMAGDQFSLTVNSWYKKNGASPGTPVDPLADLLTALTTSVGSLAGGHGATAGALQGGSILNAGTSSFLGSQTPVSGKPKAFVNWVLFDEQFKLVSSSSGSQIVGSDDSYTTHTKTGMPVDKNGYLYIYVSNETPNIDVFFDNLQVTHVRGAILEETHYYPFGLTMVGISSKALAIGNPENKLKYNGIEKENDLQIEIYDAQFRELDGQVGRWWQIDPVTDGYESISPYASMYNNPITYSDKLGNEGQACCWFTFDKESFMDGVRWINNNLNPLTPIVEFVSGKSMSSDLKEDKPRLETLKQSMAPVPVKVKGAGVALSKAEQLKLNAEKGGLSEKKVLTEEGLKKNTTPITVTDPKTGKQVTTIPDAIIENGATVEVKDTKKLSDSKQLRAQNEVSQQNGQKAVVITGTKTVVSKTVVQKMDVQRKDYIGPQK
ncbi:DUF6443 domain-containing protein [Pedobacter sp. ASV28]|uniref:DUF6443 domain-containing protein n=1 Tax=Pedobacter sp. ASV28 TaxID=2795123 RepID=UPI0018EC7C9B|nr:DUF6443 domain-containing protein [Pedobacter sp. ASV28]